MSSALLDLRDEQLAHRSHRASLRRVPHLPLLARVWELRDNLSSYVALAEALDTVLVTADGRIERASGINCEIAVLG
jgi:predicted nucleic acid-binding protein